jgi:hypothetical protein
MIKRLTTAQKDAMHVPLCVEDGDIFWLHAKLLNEVRKAVATTHRRAEQGKLHWQ